MIMNMHTLKTVDVFGYSYDPCTTMNAAIVTPKKIDVIVTYHRNQRALRFVRGLIGMTRSMRWTSGNAGCFGLPLRIRRLPVEALIVLGFVVLLPLALQAR
jgi:hypothetical protein